MKKKLWSTMSSDLHEKVKEYQKEEGFPTATKAVMNILDSHNEVKIDFRYSGYEAKKIVMTVPETLYNRYRKKAEKAKLSNSEWVRCVLNSFFAKEGTGT